MSRVSPSNSQMRVVVPAGLEDGRVEAVDGQPAPPLRWSVPLTLYLLLRREADHRAAGAVVDEPLSSSVTSEPPVLSAVALRVHDAGAGGDVVTVRFLYSHVAPYR
jgi:hypothetical protein